MLYHQSNIIESLRKDHDESRKSANEAHMQTEELAQYIRRDCLEISGIAPNEELSCKGVVRSVGNAIDVSVSDMDILVSHPIPSFNTTAPPKIIVKFTRREIRDRFYYHRNENSRSLRGNRSRTSPVLHWSDGQGRVYQKLPLISTTLNVIFPQLFLTSSFNRRPVSSVGRAPVCWAGGRRFKPGRTNTQGL